MLDMTDNDIEAKLRQAYYDFQIKETDLEIAKHNALMEWYAAKAGEAKYGRAAKGTGLHEIAKKHGITGDQLRKFKREFEAKLKQQEHSPEK